MYQMIITAIQRALAMATPAALKKAAAALSNHIGAPVAANAGSIMAAVKGFVRGNTTTSLVVTSVLAQAGLDVVIDKMTQLAEGNPTYSKLLDEIGKAGTQLLTERSAVTGDTKMGTAHGKATEDVNTDVALLVAVNGIISTASRAVGGIETLRAIRAAMFLEDADFINYIALKGR